MSSITLPTLSEEEKSRALIRISQFVLRDEIGEIRDDLQEKIVEMALFWGTKEEQAVTLEDVIEIVRKELLVIALPRYVLEGTLARLLSKETIRLMEGDKYCLKSLKRKEITEVVQKNSSRFDEINKYIIESVAREYGKELTPEQEEETLGSFYSFLASLFLERTSLSARIITKKEAGFIPTEFPLRTLTDSLAKTSDLKMRDAKRNAIVHLFQESPEQFVDFLFSAMQNLVCFQILNLDPECKSLEKEAFKSKILFLDTNILLGLLCTTHSLHKMTTQLVDLTKMLGAKCVVSKRTFREYSANLREADVTYKNWQAPYRLFEHADNEFLASYWEEKKSSPSQTWAGYYYRMKSIESILKKMEIEYYEKEHDGIFKKSYFGEISRQVYKCCLAIKRRRKDERVCDHDAYHLLLIRELRKNEENVMLGPNHWFATGDETLYCVDNVINKFYPEGKTPSSMLCNIWIDMISPFLPSTIRSEKAREVFSQLIRQQFATMPFEIKTEDLVLIQGEWVKYDWLEAEDIRRIMNEEWTRQYIQKVKWAKIGRVPFSQMEKNATAFAAKLKEELKSLQDRKMAKLQDQIDGLSTQVRTLEAGQTTMEQTIIRQQNEIDEKQHTITNQQRRQEVEDKFKLVMRAAAGAAGLILLLSPLVLILLKIIPLDVIAVLYCSVSFIMGAICLFIAIAYEKVKVWLGARLHLNIGQQTPKENQQESDT